MPRHFHLPRSPQYGPVVGSKSRVSEILSGKRSIGKAQAKSLAAFFHTGVEVFL